MRPIESKLSQYLGCRRQQSVGCEFVEGSLARSEHCGNATQSYVRMGRHEVQ